MIHSDFHKLDNPAWYALTETQKHFAIGSNELKCYRKNIVSFAGERIRMNGFTEISALVTHPEFTGRKYAQHLISYIVNKNINDGIIPFLHVSAINKRAIKVYEFLGFEKRRIISFTKIKRLK